MGYKVNEKIVPREDHLKERLLVEGVKSLTDSELLAILLGKGTNQMNALELATNIINCFGGIRQLLEVSPEELQEITGIGIAKASQIKVALELGKRISLISLTDKPTIYSPKDVVNILMEEMRYLDREHLVALFLNSKNQVLLKDTISIGTLTSSQVHPREVFKNAIRRNASAIILVHNHPSGDPTPSKSDLKTTLRLKEVGEIVGIEVLDHLIIGDNKFISLKAKSLM